MAEVSRRTVKWRLASSFRSRATLDARPKWFEGKVLIHVEWVEERLTHYFPQMQDAEDIIQKALIRLWEGVEPEKLVYRRRYLMKTAINIAIDQLRARSSAWVDTAGGMQNLAWIAGADPAASAEETVVARDAWRQFWEAVGELTPRQHKLIELRYWDGLTVSSIAGQLGTSLSLVEKEIRAALRFLEPVLNTILAGEASDAEARLSFGRLCEKDRQEMLAKLHAWESRRAQAYRDALAIPVIAVRPLARRKRTRVSLEESEAQRPRIARAPKSDWSLFDALVEPADRWFVGLHSQIPGRHLAMKRIVPPEPNISPPTRGHGGRVKRMIGR